MAFYGNFRTYDNQKKRKQSNAGNASDTSLLCAGSDSSSKKQGESSSPRYDSDADGTQPNVAFGTNEDDHIRPSSGTVILATL
ncbi:hypothetical protein CTI12_AA514960 [Artemisia annua]|uniref:Uncharacterized protein n=1 Tax=Artemisia annua TaxID=35608 RepID=A0A2U1L9N2_ARTAN|nr:hypothetical protein CTI12_AA514960 [Artemisia annua]